MKALISVILMFGAVTFVAAQVKPPVVQPKVAAVQPVSDELRNIVETEKLLAKNILASGARTAYLAAFSDDGIVFQPTERNGLLYWRSRGEVAETMSRNVSWADVSSDGKFGYTTGGWSQSPKTAPSKPVSSGEFLTIWQKSTTGGFKVVLEIAVNHPPAEPAANWRSPFDAGTGGRASRDAVDSGTLTDIFSNKSMANGYFNYLAEDCRVLRDGNMPFHGRQTAFFGLERLDKNFPPSAFLNFNGNMSKIFGNMMYVNGVYQLTADDKSIKKWNFVQIWKFRAGRWQIVADVFSPAIETKR